LPSAPRVAGVAEFGLLDHHAMIGIIIAALVVVAIVAFLFFRKAGYRGAIGFKSRHSSEIATVRLTGFSKPVDCRTLAQGEHSFNYLGRQDIPAEVQVAWRLVGNPADKTATVSLSAVPKNAADGELFFVLSSDGTWSVEYAPQLQVDKLK
jgi:hypothetical protein